MPNRIIKDSIHTSDKVNQMTDFQFRVWVSLMTYVDDFGRGDARPAVIRGTCFPLREEITNSDVDEALRAIAGIGLIVLYVANNKPYLYMANWEEHQRIRNKVSKCPPPDSNSPTIDSNSPTNVCLNPIQSNTIQNTNPNPDCESNNEPETEDNQLYDRNFRRLVVEYNKQIGEVPGGSAEELFKSYYDDLGADAMIEAIRHVNLQQPSNPWTYLKRVLDDFAESGIRDANSAIAHINERIRRANVGRIDRNRNQYDYSPQPQGNPFEDATR